jgi:hypothetical protein
MDWETFRLRTGIQTTDGEMHPPHFSASVKSFVSLISIKLSGPIEQELASLNWMPVDSHCAGPAPAVEAKASVLVHPLVNCFIKTLTMFPKD